MRNQDEPVDGISSEHSIVEHTFICVIKGKMQFYDGSRSYVLESGNCGIARKNRFARYKKEKVNDELEKVFIFFDEIFLRLFQEKYQVKKMEFISDDTILPLTHGEYMVKFINSLLPYYVHGKISETFYDLKREELMLIILENQPELAGVFFDFNIPEKVNLEEFMNRNFSFNVSIPRFAYLTGRSLSAFKRDFNQVFHDTPARWLVRKRLEEAHFLMSNRHKLPSEIFIELGFENLSHFSFAFKKHFGFNPRDLTKKRKT